MTSPCLWLFSVLFTTCPLHHYSAAVHLPFSHFCSCQVSTFNTSFWLPKEAQQRLLAQQAAEEEEEERLEQLERDATAAAAATATAAKGAALAAGAAAGGAVGGAAGGGWGGMPAGRAAARASPGPGLGFGAGAGMGMGAGAGAGARGVGSLKMVGGLVGGVGAFSPRPAHGVEDSRGTEESVGARGQGSGRRRAGSEGDEEEGYATMEVVERLRMSEER